MKKKLMLFFAICVCFNLIAQKKADLPGLTVEQLNLYKKKATHLRNEGIALTIAGTGTAIVGLTLYNKEDEKFDFGEELNRLGKALFVSTLGVISAGVGIPLWVVGSDRKAAAEVLLLNKDQSLGNSYGVGLGLKIRF